MSNDLLRLAEELRAQIAYCDDDVSPPGDIGSFGEVPFGVREAAHDLIEAVIAAALA